MELEVQHSKGLVSNHLVSALVEVLLSNSQEQLQESREKILLVDQKLLLKHLQLHPLNYRRKLVLDKFNAQ